MIEYKWYLKHSGVEREAHPIWKDDLAMEYAFETGQMFRRSALSGNIVFIAEDYDWIMQQPFSDKISVIIRVKWSEDTTFVDYWKGMFYRTDCTIASDDSKITVKPTVDDNYTKILAGLDKEYDLIKINTRNRYVNLYRRPMLQVYAGGDTIVSCFLGGMSWEQEVVNTEATKQEMVDTYHFANIGRNLQIAFNPAPAGLTTGFFGTVSHGIRVGEWEDFINEEGDYYMTYFQDYTTVGFLLRCVNGLRIYRVGTTSPVIWEFSQQNDTTGIPEFLDIPASFTMVAQVAGLDDLTAMSSYTDLYMRWVMAYQTGADKIPTDDIVAYNRNYKYCRPYDEDDIIRITTRSSTTPTEWGNMPNGRYYEKPELTGDDISTTNALYPVARNGWLTYSIWLRWTTAMSTEEESNRVQTQLKNAYAIEDVIQALLSEIDPEIKFEASTDYSQILFGTTAIRPYSGRLMMTPKSNLKVAEYDRPAMKAPVTLNEVLKMLKNTMACYWFIDEVELLSGVIEKHLRIEHVSWFKAGGTYSESALVVGYDLTALTNTRNGKGWSFNTGTYNFDKVDMTERYEYAWMDNASNAFKGQAIEVLSNWVEKGKVEEINIAKFNADVDYIMLNPSDVSDDGFALMCCNIISNELWLSFNTFLIDDNFIELQNFQLAMIMLQPTLLISDMPSYNIKVNGTARTSKGIQRNKKQQVKVPYVVPDMNMLQLVKTTIGNGEIERASIRLTSRMTQFNLRYDTTEQ